MVACVVQDPRIDGQLDERDWYLASLLLALKPSLAPIATFLQEEAPPAKRWEVTGRELAVDVLGRMARAGDDEAAVLLARHAASGSDWASAIRNLAEARVRPERYLAGFLERFADDATLLDELEQQGFDLPGDPTLDALAEANERLRVASRRLSDRRRIRKEERQAARQEHRGRSVKRCPRGAASRPGPAGRGSPV